MGMSYKVTDIQVGEKMDYAQVIFKLLIQINTTLSEDVKKFYQLIDALECLLADDILADKDDEYNKNMIKWKSKLDAENKKILPVHMSKKAIDDEYNYNKWKYKELVKLIRRAGYRDMRSGIFED